MFTVADAKADSLILFAQKCVLKQTVCSFGSYKVLQKHIQKQITRSSAFQDISLVFTIFGEIFVYVIIF